MSRILIVALCALAWVVFAGNVNSEKLDAPDAPTDLKILEVPIEVANPQEAAGRTRILQALAEPTSFEFNEMPLSDVVAFLKDRHHIEIQLDTKSLEDASIGVDTPVTRHLEGISLRSALLALLHGIDLTYTIQDELLLVTTPEAADREMLVRIYPVGDLISAKASEKPHVAFDALIDVVQGTVGNNTWQDHGGKGSIQAYLPGQALVVRQNLSVHDEIEPLLEALRWSRTVESHRLQNQPIARPLPAIFERPQQAKAAAVESTEGAEMSGEDAGASDGCGEPEAAPAEEIDPFFDGK